MGQACSDLLHRSAELEDGSPGRGLVVSYGWNPLPESSPAFQAAVRENHTGEVACGHYVEGSIANVNESCSTGWLVVLCW